MKNIAIIDVGSGNLYSVEKAVRHVADSDAEISICSDAYKLEDATHIILPGVGAFASCIKGLNALPNMRSALESNVLSNKKPFLGICVGMQMLLERSFEYGEVDGLGWFKGEVRALSDNKNIINDNLKIPHMGWNNLNIEMEHKLLEGVSNGDDAYFVHSYHCELKENVVVSTVDYGSTIVAAIARDNIFATQFHPEKSQKTGLRILQNFIEQ